MKSSLKTFLVEKMSVYRKNLNAVKTVSAFSSTRKKTVVGILMLFLTYDALSQQDPQFSQYMFSTPYYNPGSTGANGYTRLLAIYRNQWTGYLTTLGDTGAPSTQLFTATTLLNKIRSGIGLHVVNSSLGLQNDLEAQVAYAYHLHIGQSRLGFGIRTGIYSRLIDFDRYDPIDVRDPQLNRQGKQSQFKPDLAAGVFFYNKKYYVGVSLTHLLRPEFDFGVSRRNRLVPHIYANAGYSYQINFNFRLDVSGLVKSDFKKTTFDVSALLYFKNILWGGVSFRQSEAIIPILGYNFLKNKSLTLGYALDYVIENQQGKQATSHEFMLMYKLPIDINSERKVIRTPRYRH